MEDEKDMGSDGNVPNTIPEHEEDAAVPPGVDLVEEQHSCRDRQSGSTSAADSSWKTYPHHTESHGRSFRGSSSRYYQYPGSHPSHTTNHSSYSSNPWTNDYHSSQNTPLYPTQGVDYHQPYPPHANDHYSMYERGNGHGNGGHSSTMGWGGDHHAVYFDEQLSPTRPSHHRAQRQAWNDSTATFDEPKSPGDVRASMAAPAPTGYGGWHHPFLRLSSGADTPPRTNRYWVSKRNSQHQHQRPRASRRLNWEHSMQQRGNYATDEGAFEGSDFASVEEKDNGRRCGASFGHTGANATEMPRDARKSNNKPSSSSATSYIFKLRPYDVLCGRGVPNKVGQGNKFFKELVRKDQLEYISCRRNEKPPIATNIIEIIRSRGGRFLRRVRVTQPGAHDRYGWTELAENRIYEKVCQALRDGAPQIRQRMLELDATKGKNNDIDKENSRNLSASPCSEVPI